jgi:DNA-binding NtrC family response regulator
VGPILAKGAGMTSSVLIIDDDSDHCELLEAVLARLGYTAESTTSATDALARAAARPYRVILTDLAMREMSGLDLCQQLLIAAPDVPVVVVTGDKTTEAAIEALRRGAFDYVTKPIDAKLLGMSLARSMHRSRVLAELDGLNNGARRQTPNLLGESVAMRRTLELIARVSRSETSVLIHGETGAGKELVARAIHDASARAAGPFVAINCAAVPANLLESELFGHSKGAFTDAKQSRSGLFVEASGGTLFLDEIGDMPLEMQSKLLRALQERRVRPVGSNSEVPFDARIFAATHRDLEAEVRAGRFRQDLYYRINVVCVDVPPLRERDGDILRLADHFLERFCMRAGRSRVRLSTQVAERLLAHDWPGNVRELENCMERLAALSRYDIAICSDLPASVRGTVNDERSVIGDLPEGLLDLAELERNHILKVLDRLKGNKSRAAELLGLDRRTLYRKLDVYRKQQEERVSGSPAPGAASTIPCMEEASSALAMTAPESTVAATPAL